MIWLLDFLEPRLFLNHMKQECSVLPTYTFHINSYGKLHISMLWKLGMPHVAIGSIIELIVANMNYKDSNTIMNQNSKFGNLDFKTAYTN